MKSIQLCFLVILLSLSAFAQDRQAGLSFTLSTPSSTLGLDSSPGGALTLFVPFKEYYALHGNAGFRKEVTSSSTDHQVFSLDYSARYSPLKETPLHVQPFLSAGLDFQHHFGSSSHSRTSPKFGAGLAFKNHLTAEYAYLIPDLTSSFKSRAHHLTFEGYIPFGATKYLIHPGLQFRRVGLLTPTFTQSNQLLLSLGVSRRF